MLHSSVSALTALKLSKVEYLPTLHIQTLALRVFGRRCDALTVVCLARIESKFNSSK